MNEPHENAAFKTGEPPVTPTGTERPIAYSPVSGWALAGCIAGSVFAVLVAFCTIVALTQGVPLFFPLWILGLAVVGVVLSLIGQKQVQNSDGTRAGARLASVGLWLSLVSGLGYFSYYYVTGLALENQANAFLMEKSDDDTGFFPRMREAAENPVQFNAAFLLTRAPTQRGSARPENDQAMRDNFDIPRFDSPSATNFTPGELTQFREHVFARLLFKESAKDAVITPLAVQEWQYEKRMYKVIRIYRIKTKEVAADFRVAVYSTEGEASGEGRKWFLNLRETALLDKKLTPFGDGLRILRQQAGTALEEWAKNPAKTPLRDIAARDGTDWNQLLPDAAQRKERRAIIDRTFTSDDHIVLSVQGRPDEVGRWEQVDGKIRIYHGVRFHVAGVSGGPTALMVDGYVVLEPIQAVNPDGFDGTQRLDWNLVRILFTAITSASEKRPRPL